ncbi:type II toxin-antitoxin system RelE/ParE family toxin [Thermodesulfobacteriota bacterium]
MSKVIVHHHPAKYLRRLPKETKERIKKILKELEDNPLEHSQVKHMVGEWAGYHRIRVGKLRVIFWYDKSGDVVYIDHIGPRGDIYK